MVNIPIVEDKLAVRVAGAMTNREGYDFEANEHVFETADDRPGGLVEVSVVAAEDSEVLSIPVLDGSLDQYRPYLPESGVEPAP